MSEQIARKPATDADGRPGSGLVVSEVSLTITLEFDSTGQPPQGCITQNEGHPVIRHWPDRVWRIGDTGRGADNGIDISHGEVVLRVSGPRALAFLAPYLAADLPSPDCGTIRSRMSDYDLVLWWLSDQEVHVAVSRSFAQSFVDHLRHLERRQTTPVPES